MQKYVMYSIPLRLKSFLSQHSMIMQYTLEEKQH